MQRLDSLGLLAAGVAHGFKNLLAIIVEGAHALPGAVPATARDDLDPSYRRGTSFEQWCSQPAEAPSRECQAPGVHPLP